MNNEQNIISPSRVRRLKVQGYRNFKDYELSKLAFGNRFAYVLCSTLLLIGVITSNILLLSVMLFIAIFGILLPYHPFDYIYNGLISNLMNKPKLPPRSKQLKFACIIATLGIASTIFLFYAGLTLAGYITGGSLFLVAFLVSTTDICIPSIIYNFIFKVEI
jgi:hypothetical protein